MLLAVASVAYMHNTLFVVGYFCTPAISEWCLLPGHDCNGQCLVAATESFLCYCKYCAHSSCTNMPMFSPFLPSISDKYLCTGYYCMIMVPLVLGRVSSHGVVSVQFVQHRLSHSTDMIVALRMQGLGLVYDVTTCQRNVKGAVHPADHSSDLCPNAELPLQSVQQW